MSLDLRDIRIKVSPSTHAWLEAKSRVTGEDISSIARELLDARADSELAVARLADHLMRREGLPGIAGDDRGSLGIVREDRG